jgi:hypothetical protein
MLHRFEKLTKSLLHSSESQQDDDSNPFENGPLTEENLYNLAYSYGLQEGNPLDTLHAIEQTSLADKARELGALQDIARVYGGVLDRAGAAELEETIRDYTFRLIASKLPLYDVAGLRLGNEYTDDAGTAEEIDFQEFLKIAQSWDYLDQDPRITDAITLLAHKFDEHTTQHTIAAFRLAIEKGITFSQANLDLQARYNDMPVREANRMLAGLAFDACSIPTEEYDWLFASNSTRHPRITENAS